MIGRIGLGRVISRSLSSAENANHTKYTIQPAIERSSTDLLKALSDTVGADKTAPHFAFIDDPITIPSTESAKKTYYMAKELGKRAARELATEWPTLFAFDRDQPRLPAFRFEHLPDPLQIEPTEVNLLKMIESREVEDCCILYERMRSDNVDVSEGTQLQLFRLVAYYNSSNVPFAEWQNWAGMRNYGETNEKPWKSAGVADLLFETLPKTDETVSIMICGMCKFSDQTSVGRAEQLYKEHLESGGKIYREAYDALISTSNFSNAKKIAAEMAKKKMAPSVSTFNALLVSASKLPKVDGRTNAFTSILAEMKDRNVEPTLAEYHIIVGHLIESHLINMDDKETGEVKDQNEKYQKRLSLAVSWLSQIIDKIEGKTLESSSSSCNLFFAEAMGIAYRAANLEIGQRLLKVYESKENKVKMPAFTTESMFYNRYLQLFIEQSTSIEQVHQTYKDFVPRLVGVSRSLSSAVYQKLARQSNWPLLRRVIEDGMAAGQMTTILAEEMRRQLINVQYHTLSVSEREEFTNLVQKLVSVWIEYSNFTEEWSKRMQRKLTPSQISECALLLTRIGEIQKANELLELLLDEESTMGETATVMAKGFARPSTMAELFEDSLRRKDSNTAALCFEIMALTSNRSKLEPLANRIFERCNLSEQQQKIIQSFVRLRPQ